MARYNDNSSLGWKILSLFLTLILIAGVITGVVFWQKGNIQFIPVGQEQTDEQPDNEEQPNEDSGKPATGENGEELPADQTIPMPMAMAFRSAAALDGESAAYDSVTLTATVKPNDATNKAVDWSIAFVNPSSEWATGKTVTDYVTVTPQSDGSTTATVQCLQPFGEQIKVVVTSRSNTEAKAECSVDFVKRAIGLSINFVSAANNVTANSSSPEVVIPSNFSNLHNGGVTIEETAGTITDEFSYNVKIKGNDDTASAFNSQSGGAIISAKEFAFTSDITLTSEYLFNNLYTIVSPAGDLSIGANVVAREALEKPFAFVSVTATGEYSTFDCEFSLKADSNLLSIGVTSVDLDNSTVII